MSVINLTYSRLLSEIRERLENTSVFLPSCDLKSARLRKDDNYERFVFFFAIRNVSNCYGYIRRRSDKMSRDIYQAFNMFPVTNITRCPPIIHQCVISITRGGPACICLNITFDVLANISGKKNVCRRAIAPLYTFAILRYSRVSEICQRDFAYLPRDTLISR